MSVILTPDCTALALPSLTPSLPLPKLTRTAGSTMRSKA